MEIKILGSGCSSCKKLKVNTQRAIEELAVEATIIKIEDFKEIMKYGVMTTPAILVNDKIKMYGKVCTVEEIKRYIQEEA